MTTRIRDESYLSILLHAAKYGAQEVCGALLASSDGTIVCALPLVHGTIVAPLIEAGIRIAESLCASEQLQVAGLYYASDVTSHRKPSGAVMAVADRLVEKHAGSTEFGVAILLLDSTLLASDEANFHALLPYRRFNRAGQIADKSALQCRPRESAASSSSSTSSSSSSSSSSQWRLSDEKVCVDGVERVNRVLNRLVRVDDDVDQASLQSAALLLDNFHDVVDHLSNPSLDFVNRPLLAKALALESR
jgi:Uncharacterised protein family (UPF0172)